MCAHVYMNIIEAQNQNRSSELSHFMFNSCRQTTDRIPGPTLPCGVVSFRKKSRESGCWRTFGWMPLRSVIPWKRCVPLIHVSIPTNDVSRRSERIETLSNVPLGLDRRRILLREPNMLCNTRCCKFHSETILPGACHSRGRENGLYVKLCHATRTSPWLVVSVFGSFLSDYCCGL